MNQQYEMLIEEAEAEAIHYLERLRQSDAGALLSLKKESEKIMVLYNKAYAHAHNSSEEERDFIFRFSDFLLLSFTLGWQIDTRKTITSKKLKEEQEGLTFQIDRVIAQNDKYKQDYLIKREELLAAYNKILSKEGVTVKDGGCYIATAVYGSYDCPQVWTLRRYRDNKLANSFWGQIFIHGYYLVSPTLVRLFGNQKWFNKLFRGLLDNITSDLQRKGYDSTPYMD